MISLCIERLEETIQSLGFAKNEILTDEDAINNFKGSKFASIAFGETKMTKDGVRAGVQDDLETMKRTYRYRLYELSIPVTVLLADRSKASVESHLSNLLTQMGSCFKDQNNNPIEIAASDPAWLEDKSRLNPRAGVELTITFNGGIYKDKIVNLLKLETALEIQTEIGGVTDVDE